MPQGFGGSFWWFWWWWIGRLIPMTHPMGRLYIQLHEWLISFIVQVGKYAWILWEQSRIV